MTSRGPRGVSSDSRRKGTSIYGKYSLREKQIFELKMKLNHEKNLQNYDLSTSCQLTLIRNTFMSVVILHTAVSRESAVVSLLMMCLLLRPKPSRILSSAHAQVFSIRFPPFPESFPALSCYF